MDYLKGIIDVDVVFKSFKDGLIMFKNTVGLDVIDAEKVGRTKGDVQQMKEAEITYTKERNLLGYHNLTVDKAHGERFMNRKMTNITATGTIYGMAQNFIMNVRKHSFSGMNKLYITSEGLPNDTAIVKRMRELGITSDTKEARYGLLFNSIFTNDYYDNATSLFVHLLLRINVLGMYERNTRYNDMIKLSKGKVENLLSLDDEDVIKQVVNVVATENKMTLAPNDPQVPQILEKMDNWLQANPMNDEKFEYKVQVWKMYEYSDGHSKSGSSFGRHFGFTHGKFIVPQGLFKTNEREGMVIKPVPRGMMMSDESVNLFGRAKAFLNCSGMSDRQVRILSHILEGSKRCTPFLADQTLQFGLEDATVYAYGIPQIQGEATTYTQKDLREVLNLLVNNHRYHEELAEATKLIRYWLAQPATETVESHWWTHMKRALILPELGLKRASIHILTEGEGVCITNDSIEIAKMALKQNDRFIVESVFANTCWYWGEYLSIYNALDLDELYSKVHSEQDCSVAPVYRPEVIISSMVGRAIPRSTNKDLGTMMRISFDELRRLRVPFGDLQIDHLEEYGYNIQDDKIILGSLVPPSCVALILGLAGSLLSNTPYSSLFKTNPATRKGGRFVAGTGLNYNDLWAHGVINRWHGYDLSYTHPFRSGRHKIYAANNVQVAMPPVNPLTSEVPLSYTVKQFTERERLFGSSTERLLDCKLLCSWQRYGPKALETADYDADYCTKILTSNTLLRTFDVVLADGEDYVVAVKSKYALQTADFHIVEVTAGIPLPVDDYIPPSHEEEEPEPETELGDTGEVK